MAQHKRRVYPTVSAASGINTTDPQSTNSSLNINQLGTPVQQLQQQQQQQFASNMNQINSSLSNLHVNTEQDNSTSIPNGINNLSNTANIFSPNVPLVNSVDSLSNTNLEPPQFATQQITTSDGSIRPMNELYTVDLMRCIPPPIADLKLNPPPALVPNEKCLVPNINANASMDYIRCTLNAIPKTNSLLERSKLPFALVIKPYQSLDDSINAPVLIDDGIVSRCKRCRVYFNPFVTLSLQARKWRCNFCRYSNELPMQYSSTITGDPTLFTPRTLNSMTMSNNTTNNSNFVFDRLEVQNGVVEYIAPPQYSVREPPPSVYNFVIDVSRESIANGTLVAATTVILNNLQNLPNHDNRTLISIVCVDDKLYHFQIPDDEISNRCTLLEVSDIDEPFIPSPTNLLTSVTKSQNNIKKLLQDLPTIFAIPTSDKFALGPALRSSFKLMSNIGGKIIIISSTLPNCGEGALKIKSLNKLNHTANEYNESLTGSDPFYKSFPIDCNKSQITVDLFLTNNGTFSDIATLSNLARYTAGQIYHYPKFNISNNNQYVKFCNELGKHLAMDISMETVMRARGSRGIKMKEFFGHFFSRSSDLCAFPTMPRDQSYVFEACIDETINSDYSFIQVAVLLSSNTSQRRIRVITLALPTTNSMHELYASMDQLATFNYYTQVAINKAKNSSITKAQDFLKEKPEEILGVFKKEVVSRNDGGILPLKCAANMRMLPLLMHCLTKHVAFRNGIIPIDERSMALNEIETAPLKYLIKFVYPTIYSLHDLTDDIEFPEQTINASLQNLETYGLYLIDNGHKLYLWIGGMAVEALVNDVFGVDNLFDVPVGEVELPVVENSAFNARIRNIIKTIRENNDLDSVIYEPLVIVKGRSLNESAVYNQASQELAHVRQEFLNNFVEDNIFKTESYREYLQILKTRTNK